MTTMVISIENSADIGNIVVAVNQLKGVVGVKVRKENEFERIHGLPYTHEELMADIYMAEKNHTAGQTITTKELKKRITTW